MTTALLDQHLERSPLRGAELGEVGFDPAPLPGQMHLWRRHPGSGEARLDGPDEVSPSTGDGVVAVGPSLDLVLGVIWSSLRGAQTVACPACGGVMQPSALDGSEPVEGYCGDCGASLS